jgi:pimeloyl-ACP methyl ester carboxylesterase
MTSAAYATAHRALMVHGAGGGAWEWRIWQRVFEASGISTATVELMPNGTLAQTRYPDYLAQLQQAWQSSQANILVGASLGGLLAAELASQAPSNLEALILAAPVPPTGLARNVTGDLKRWAHGLQLANTIAALPDADPASQVFAHQHWRDESALVLNSAYAGREFSMLKFPTLMFIAERDQDIDEGALRAWVVRERMDVHYMRECSHAGLLLGRHGARAATLAVAWLQCHELLA